MRKALITRRDNKDGSTSLVFRGRVVFRTSDPEQAVNFLTGWRSAQA